MKTAALVVIGDEILSGKIRDENSFVFTRAMFERGVRVRHIETILDHIDTIAQTVLKLSQTYDYVCTSGGIGPTHDDKTYEGVAKAFGLPMHEHEEALYYFQKAQEQAGRGNQVSLAQRKMLCFPRPCEAFFVAPLWLPLVRVRNVLIYPGVPSLFERLLHGLITLFEAGELYREIIYTDLSEVIIAEKLARVQDRCSEITIGSYPQMPGKTYNVMVTIEGEKKELVTEACNELLPLIEGRLKH